MDVQYSLDYRGGHISDTPAIGEKIAKQERYI